jgi:cyclic beta-1,2-glucan synthetase
MPAVKTPKVRGGLPASLPSPKELHFWNGFGGFTEDGREYVTVLRDGAHTPAPWSHVVANPDFGFLVTATGGGYAWAVNSQQNQVTAWSNDATCDPPGEVSLRARLRALRRQRARHRNRIDPVRGRDRPRESVALAPAQP